MSRMRQSTFTVTSFSPLQIIYFNRETERYIGIINLEEDITKGYNGPWDT